MVKTIVVVFLRLSLMITINIEVVRKQLIMRLKYLISKVFLAMNWLLQICNIYKRECCYHLSFAPMYCYYKASYNCELTMNQWLLIT